MPDNDSKMIEELGVALTSLQIQYRASSISDRMKLWPDLRKALANYNKCQVKLLDDGVVVTDEDLAEMAEIRSDIDKAAETQQLIEAAVRVAAFIAARFL